MAQVTAPILDSTNNDQARDPPQWSRRANNCREQVQQNAFRGRDASYLAPPAQIRTSPIRAYGSHLGCVTARRDILTKFRLCFSACDTVPRYCARPVLC